MNNNLKLLAVAGSALAIVACQGVPSPPESDSTPRSWQATQQSFTCPPPSSNTDRSTDPRPPECPRMPGLRALV